MAEQSTNDGRPFYDPPSYYVPGELLVSFRHPPDRVHARLRVITPALNDQLAQAGLQVVLHQPAVPEARTPGKQLTAEVVASELSLSGEQVAHEQISLRVTASVPASSEEVHSGAASSVPLAESPVWSFVTRQDDGGQQQTVARYHVQQLTGEGGPDPVLAATASIASGLDLLNERLRGVAQVRAAIPNWPATGEPVSWPVGGPGGRPAPEPAPEQEAVAAAARWHFSFPTQEVERLAPAGDQGDAQVLVVVLDTSPSQAEVDAAARRYPHNALLAEVATGGARPIAVDAVDLGVVRRPPPPEYRAVRERDEPYLMPDHGLFVAGIIRDIAPACEIRLVRMLNDYGGGTAQHLIAGLQYVDSLARTESRPIVVNISAAGKVPHLPDLNALYKAAGLPNPYLVPGDDAATVTRATLPLLEIIADLSVAPGDHSLIFVAAAGNDCKGSDARPNPDPPALFDQTIGVAALGARLQPAPYSNKGDDESAVKNGIATFGGVSSSPAPDRPVDAVRGLFISTPVPVTPHSNLPSANTNGWARWIGTSFATPIISGLVARMLARHPALPLQPSSPDGDSVLGRLKRLAAANDEPALNCHAIAAAQHLVEL